MVKHETIKNFVLGQTVLDGSLPYADALRDAREQLRNDYSAKRIWMAAPVDVIKLAATVLTSQDIFKLRRADFYVTLVDDALDLLFYEDCNFSHTLKAQWKENARKVGNYSA